MNEFRPMRQFSKISMSNYIIFNLGYQMIRKITSWLPKHLMCNNNIHFLFSNENNKPQQPHKKQKKLLDFNILEKSLIKYINILQKQTSRRIENKSFAISSKYFKGFFSNSPPNSSDNLFQQKIKFQSHLVLIALLIIALLSFFGGNKSGVGSIMERKASRIVSESQMIGFLSSGNYHPDILIIRQSVQTGEGFIYQNICIVKEANRNDYPISCIVINLTSFLEQIEKINFPYRIAFDYAAETKPAKKTAISIGNIILFSLIAFLFYQYKTGKLNFSNPGMSDIMNTKKFEPIKPENIKTHFKDVAGMHQAKQEITQFVDFLKNPDKYIQMGAKIPKGALLTGPPGTGKTLLARACAGEAGVPFFYVSGSEFVEKYVGMGANRVRSLFDSAAKAAPSIIFIDEIDAIGKKRNSGPFANEQKQNTLNQLLVNMDGFDSKHKIIVMAATNIKEALDPALLRPGRFDRSVEIGLPNFDERSQILQVHLTKVKFSSAFTVEEFAKKISILTPGFSGAQLANICNEAAILAARNNKEEIDLPQFQKATERVMAGLEKRNLFSDQQKQCLAYYECGKAVAAWFTQGADPVIKISITPYSKSSKGYSHQLKNEMPLKTQAQLINKVVCYLAGRTSEKLMKGYTTSNGDEDMKKAKKIITYLVVKFGMSKLGKIGYPDIDYMRKPYSQNTEKKIDQEIERIYKECQQKTEILVKERKQYIQKLKMLILQKQTLTHNSLKEVLGDRPFANHENYEKFLNDNKKSEEPKFSAPDSVGPQ